MEFTFPHSTLIVDDIVNVSGLAIIKPDYYSRIKTILISFESARPYPFQTAFDENGLANPPELYLTKSQDGRMIGNRKIYWPLEGKYSSIFMLEFVDNQVIRGRNDINLITVYPRSENAQIFTNKAIIILTIATYFLGLVGGIKIIIDLLNSV